MMIWILMLALLAVAGVIALNWRKTQKTARKVEQVMSPAGSFADISTGRVHYIDRGAGPAVVLVHGLGGQSGNFDLGLIDDLARDHRVIALDRPGMGWSDRPASAAANPRAQAGYVAELIDILGLDKPLMVGHSLGGAICLCYALDHPDRLRGLALIAPLTLPTGKSAEAFKGLAIRSDGLRNFLSQTFAIPAMIRNAQQNLAQVFGPEPVPAAYPTKGGGMLGLRPVSFRNTSRDYVHSADDLEWMAAHYGQISVPARLLFAQGDRILNFAEQAQGLVARYPHFQLVEAPGGHMLPCTQPALCAEYIRATDAMTA